jgi:pectin methylesterase-like acyl-CoA thioesterase
MRSPWIIAASLLASLCASADAINVHGALLPADAQKVGENRYRVPEDWSGINKFYDGVYPKGQFPRKMIANIPGVKAEHIGIPNSRTTEGVNIYIANDETRIFVVPTDASRVHKKSDKKK